MTTEKKRRACRRNWIKAIAAVKANPKIPRIVLHCLMCGQRFEVERWRLGKAKTCSPPCRQRHNASISRGIRGAMQRHSGNGKSYVKLIGRHMHRRAMESSIGRKLTSDEIVHHIDGNKRNNAQDNLQIVSLVTVPTPSC
jgi:hypothetical protein